MPGFNRNGPMNKGQMTGRGRGICTNGAMAGSTGFANTQFRCPGFRRGSGQRQGQGQGLGRGYARAPMTSPLSVNRENLQQRADQLEAELNAIKEELTNISDS